MLVSLLDLYPKDSQTPVISFQQQEDFLVETKRDKHILAGYDVAYRLRLNFTDTTIITQTLGSFNDRLLNDSLAIQRLHVAISY